MNARSKPFHSPRVPLNLRLWGFRVWRRMMRRHRKALAGMDPEGGNQILLLKEGGTAYRLMLEAIASARHSIHLEMYYFAPDATGRRFAEALRKKARSGVSVRIIYDDVGSLFTSASMWRELAEAGAEIHVFHPLAPWRRGWHWNRRDHRKILVVDGKVGFAGGMNISDEYAPASEGGGGWRDTHLRIEGPAIADLQLIFMRSWIKVGGRPPRAYRLFNVQSHPGGIRARVMANQTFLARRDIRLSLLQAILNARVSIHLTHAYFIPDPGLKRALLQAARRGVDVHLIVPDNSDVAIALAAGRAAQPALLRGGVRISRRLGPVLHAKSVVIDRHWVSIGSCNLNYRSFLHNQEINVEIDDPRFGAEMEELFQDDLRQSVEIRPRDLKNRSPWRRFLDTLAFSLRFWL